MVQARRRSHRGSGARLIGQGFFLFGEIVVADEVLTGGGDMTGDGGDKRGSVESLPQALCCVIALAAIDDLAGFRDIGIFSKLTDYFILLILLFSFVYLKYCKTVQFKNIYRETFCH